MHRIGPHGHAEFVAAGKDVNAVFPQPVFQVLGRHLLPFAAGAAAFQFCGRQGGYVLFEGPDGFGIVQVLQSGPVLGAQAIPQEEEGGKGCKQTLHHSLTRIQLSGGQTPCPRSFLRVSRVWARLLDGHTDTAIRPFRKLMMVAV